MKKYLRFVEPHCTGGNAFVEVETSKAIEWQKKSFPERKYTDEEALDDFIVVNWATAHDEPWEHIN